MQVFNDDIAGIYRRVNRFLEELQKSSSANVSDISSFDMVRVRKYLESLGQYIDWIVNQPQLDLPETHPKSTELEECPVLPATENLMVNDLKRLFERARDEVTNSQSARNATGLIKFDETRLRAVLTKAVNYLNDYVEVVIPLDLPESTPAQPSTGSGRTGINP